MILKVDAIYTDGVLKPTRELTPSRQSARAPHGGDDRRAGAGIGTAAIAPPEGGDREHGLFLGRTASQARGTA